MLETLTVEDDGRVTIPDAVRTRYGFEPDTPVRLDQLDRASEQMIKQIWEAFDSLTGRA